MFYMGKMCEMFNIVYQQYKLQSFKCFIYFEFDFDVE